jgi:DNA-binding XRE family transcriptional regulator
MIAKVPEYLTSLQCRMARAGLRWDVRVLAERSHVGRTTIIRFEGEKTSPNLSTRAALRRAFEAAGVTFTGCNTVSVGDDVDDD